MERAEKIRNRIKETRIVKGYTQYYVGKRLDISQYAYHKIESGKTALKVETLIQIAIILEVKVDYLLACYD